MSENRIKQQSNWPVLQTATEALALGEAMPSGAFAAIADRMRSALESPDARRVEDAAVLLESFLRTAIAGASSDIQAVSRGETGSGAITSSDAARLYALGKIAFAQILAARVADTRVDDRFVAHVLDKRYLPLLRELAVAPLSVTDLKERTGEALATVSRKLGALRGLGIVAFRKQGNVVMNLLTPAAQDVLAAHSLPAGNAIADTAHEPAVADEEARHKLDDVRAALADHMKSPPQLHLRAVA